MINYLKGDATKPSIIGNKIIAHCCNDIGAWGRGFVLSLSARWSEPERRYREMSPKHLGDTQFVKVESDVWVANIIGQHGIRMIDNIPPIRYDALRSGLRRVGRFSGEINASICLPRIGAGLAGGDWSIIENIIQDELKGLEVFVYDLE